MLSLIVALILLAAAVVVSTWSQYRRQLLLGAAFSLPVVAVELALAGAWERFGVGTGDAIRHLVMLTISVMSVGGLAAVLADITINRWFSSSPYHRRSLLVWSVVGLAISGGMILGGQSIGLSLLVGLGVNLGWLIIVDRELLWDAFVGSLAFGVWFGVADVLFGIRASGDIQRLLFGPQPIGLTIAGLPLERVAIGMLIGALVGPLFVATKRWRSSDGLPPQRTMSKVIIGAIAVIIGAIMTAWTAEAYVLPPATTAVATPPPAVAVTAATLSLNFNHSVDRDTVRLSITPAIDGTWSFSRPVFSDHGFRQATFTFATTLQPGTTYHGTVTGLRSVWGLSSPDEPFTFTTAPAPDIVTVGLKDNPATLVNSQPLDPCQALTAQLSAPTDARTTFHFSLTPAATVTATLSSDQQSYTLTPSPCLQAGTAYALHVERQILELDPQTGAVIVGATPTAVFDQAFTTIAPPAPVPPPVVPPVIEPTPTPPPTPVTQTQRILSVALDYQDQPLSCEAAALKMALAGQGVHVSEKQIMDIVGYDPTPHRGDVWGNPNAAFVGNIAGKQNTTGYGVYWDPIARAAKHWRPARVITNSSAAALAQEIYAGHPVIIWGTLGYAYRDDWKTPAGGTVVAWKGEHARTVIGVIGPAANPTSFIINDPVAGRLTWSTATLLTNWNRFSRSGVVIE